MPFLHGIDVAEINDGTRPVRVLATSVIGVVGTAGKGPVNRNVLINGNARDAASIFGAYTDDGFTLPGAINAILQQGAAQIVAINVADPTVQHSANIVETKTFNSRNTLTVTHPYLIGGTLAIQNDITAALTLGSLGVPRAFTVAADNGSGKATFTVAKGSDYIVGELVTVSGSSVPGYNGTFAVLSRDATHVALNVAFTATATGTVNASQAEKLGIDDVTLIAVKSADGTSTLNQTQIKALGVGDSCLIEYSVSGGVQIVRDYVYDFSTGIFTRVTTGNLLPLSALQFTYQYVDPTMAGDVEIIGGVDGDGVASGMQLLLSANEDVFVKPRILIAPGYTHQKPDVNTANAVAVAFEAISDSLRAVVILDAPDGTKEDAVAYAQDFGKSRFFVHYPFYKVASPSTDGQINAVPASPFVAGIIAATDNDPAKGFWWSPSNNEVNGILGLTKTTAFSLGDSTTVSNYLNSNNVTCTVRDGGFILWGNHATDGTFLCVQRTTDIIVDSIAAAHRWALDRPLGRGFFPAVVSSVNTFLRGLIALGAIIDGKAWADPSLNTVAQIPQGQAYIDFDYGPLYPCEHLTFRAHLTDNYLVELLSPSGNVPTATN